jgi:hypothetical protein
MNLFKDKAEETKIYPISKFLSYFPVLHEEVS